MWSTSWRLALNIMMMKENEFASALCFTLTVTQRESCVSTNSKDTDLQWFTAKTITKYSPLELMVCITSLPKWGRSHNMGQTHTYTHTPVIQYVCVSVSAAALSLSSWRLLSSEVTVSLNPPCTSRWLAESFWNMTSVNGNLCWRHKPSNIHCHWVLYSCLSLRMPVCLC